MEAPVAQSSSTEQAWKAKKEQSEEETVENPTPIQVSILFVDGNCA